MTTPQERAAQEAPTCREALAELVRLHGGPGTAEFRARRQAAWEGARLFERLQIGRAHV